MWHEMNCTICGYRESTDYDDRTESQIQSVCDKGCPLCGNDSDVNPFWFQSGPDGELGEFIAIDVDGNVLWRHGNRHEIRAYVRGPIKWWPDTPTPAVSYTHLTLPTIYSV
mgnify:CR=1 FL=1